MVKNAAFTSKMSELYSFPGCVFHTLKSLQKSFPRFSTPDFSNHEKREKHQKFFVGFAICPDEPYRMSVTFFKIHHFPAKTLSCSKHGCSATKVRFLSLSNPAVSISVYKYKTRVDGKLIPSTPAY